VFLRDSVAFNGCSIILHSTLGDVFAPTLARLHTRHSRVPVPANPANVCAFAPRLPRPPDSSCARRGPARLLRRRFLGALLLEHPQPRLPRVLHLPAGTQCDAHYTLRVACVQLTAEYSGCSVDTMAHSRVQSQAAGQHRATHPASRAAALRSPASIARIRASCFSLRAAIAAKSADCGSEPSPAPAPDLELDGGGGGGRGGGGGARGGGGGPPEGGGGGGGAEGGSAGCSLRHGSIEAGGSHSARTSCSDGTVCPSLTCSGGQPD